MPPQQHFNVPIEWNETTNMPIQQFCESQQLAPTMLYYTPVSHQQQQQLQQRQQQFSGDINNPHGIVVYFLRIFRAKKLGKYSRINFPSI